MRKVSRILIADDHALFRQGIHALLRDSSDLLVVGEAANDAELLENSRQLQPDVVLIDADLPPIDGVEATRQLRDLLPETKVIVLSIRDDCPELVYSAIKAGALGFVTKTSEIGELTAAIRAVGSGQASIATGSLTSLVTVLGSGELGDRGWGEALEEALTEREEEVLDLVTQGHSNREIAGLLCISESTVRSHLHNILDKLHLSNRVQAATYALTSQRKRSSRTNLGRPVTDGKFRGGILKSATNGAAAARESSIPRPRRAPGGKQPVLQTAFPRYLPSVNGARPRPVSETSLRAG